MIRLGLGTTKNEAEAHKWTALAAKNGDVVAALNLGRYFAAGFGCVKDGAQALAWYRKAADAGEDEQWSN